MPEPLSDSEVLLDVRGLKMHFPMKSSIFSKKKNFICAVDGVDFQVKKGEYAWPGRVNRAAEIDNRPRNRSALQANRRRGDFKGQGPH